MEIKKVSNTQVKVQPEANINQTIQASRSVAASLAKETAIANQVTGITVKSLNESLNAAGQEQALLDGAKDQKQKDEYLLAKSEADEEQKLKTDLENRGTFDDLESTGENPVFIFGDENDTKAYDKIKGSNKQAKAAKLKEVMKEQKLDMSSSTFTAYGQAYQKKARAIGLNKLVINLDTQSRELALEYKEDPAGYMQAMTQYRMQVKDTIPKELHAAYDEKALVAQNAYAKKINENVTKQQNLELSAVTVDLIDQTNTNLLDAASNQNAASYKQNKQSITDLTQSMADNRLITQQTADEAIKTATDSAQNQYIMADFNDMLDDPILAQRWLEKFSTSTSEKMYGISQRQAELQGKKPGKNAAGYDIEYTTEQRDKLSKVMRSRLKQIEKSTAAKNKQYKTDNNKFAADAVTLLKKGILPNDAQSRLTNLKPGGNIGVHDYDELKFSIDHYEDYYAFNNLETVQEMNDEINELKSEKEASLQEPRLIEAYEDIRDEREKTLKDDPAQLSRTHYKNSLDEPIEYDKTNPAAYLNEIQPYMQQQHENSNAPKNLLTNEQANETIAMWNEFGPIDKITYINSLKGTPQAEDFFDQLGENGSEMKVLYNLSSGGSIYSLSRSRSIIAGQGRIDNEETTYNEQKINDVIRANLDGRLDYMDDGDQKAYRKAIANYALGANPDKVLIDIDDNDTVSMIQQAIDNVVGKKDQSFWGNLDMVIYDKTQDQVITYRDSVSPDQVKATMPVDSVFYSADPKNPLTAKTLSQEIQNGKLRLVATGVDGEYVLIRSTPRGPKQLIHTETNTDRKRPDGSYYTQIKPYKFKLWGKK